MALVHRTVDSPVGPLRLAAGPDGLRVLSFTSGAREIPVRADWVADQAGRLDGVCRELDAYFAGRLRQFTTPLAPAGTPFQRAVWAELCRIPYGETISYGELARRLGNPNAVRAVGLANGANPIPIIVPCHRVIGANGSLTGYGGGLPTKRALLDLEQQPLRLL